MALKQLVDVARLNCAEFRVVTSIDATGRKSSGDRPGSVELSRHLLNIYHMDKLLEWYSSVEESTVEDW